jgi:mannose/fructose/sorbose-specific phosphotransferase system IIA component
MIGIVLISHGDMAKGLISSAGMLAPDTSQLSALGLWPEDNPDDFQKKLQDAVKEVDTGDGVFILADMLGGTPCNRAAYFIGEKVRLLTGLSLPMLYSLLTIREEGGDLVSIARDILAEAREGMVDVNEITNKDAS